jgi:hypothetical protein
MLPLDQAESPDRGKGVWDAIAYADACAGVRGFVLVCRTLVEHHGQCRHVKHY